MTAPTLRPYQVHAVDATFAQWRAGRRRVAGIAATGAGKTVILSAIIAHFRDANPGEPVLVLAHRSELLEQAAEKLRAAMPGTRVGYVAAGRNHVTAPVIVASVQTLARERRRSRLPRFGLVVVDECHRSASQGYLTVLTALGCLEPDGPLTLGVTATFTREDSARLTDVWECVAWNVDLLDLIAQGHLVDPRFRRVLVEGLDLSAVSTSRRDGVVDFRESELGEALERAGAPGIVAAAYARHAAGRQGIVFTPNVHSAHEVASALRDVGIAAEAIDGTMGTERHRAIKRYRAGELRVLVNCNILGEGFDAPETSCVVIARPTLSKILFRQMVGRGLRPAPWVGKADCLVLDLVGATGRNNLATLDDMTSRGVHVPEDTGLLAAARRAFPAAARPGLEGDAVVSGTLAVIDVDPWELERRRTERRGAGDPEDGAGPAAPATSAAPRRRYVPVEHRDGWFLRSRAGRWFVPLTSQSRSTTGVVVVVPAGGAWRVVARYGSSGDQPVPVVFGDEDTARRAAVELALGLVPSGADRSLTDPDARWRRNRVTGKALTYAQSAGGVELDEDAYAGQAADWIALLTHGRIADAVSF